MSNMNPEVTMTLDDAVAEVLGLLTGLDLSYDPRYDRYAAITRTLNRAMRSTALEHEWSFYYNLLDAGPVTDGTTSVTFDGTTKRVRVINDDAVRLTENGVPKVWAYFLPRDALHKYVGRAGLWVSSTRDVLTFNREINAAEAGLHVEIPVMREPNMFRLPEQPEDPNAPLVDVPTTIRDQLIDFPYPDLVTLRAAYYYAQTDPVMQPRVQTLEAQYKDLMYQIIERDDRNTDAPYSNDFILPVQNSISGFGSPSAHSHPHADERGPWGR